MAALARWGIAVPVVLAALAGPPAAGAQGAQEDQGDCGNSWCIRGGTSEGPGGQVAPGGEVDGHLVWDFDLVDDGDGGECWDAVVEGLSPSPPAQDETYEAARGAAEDLGGNGVLWDACPPGQPAFDAAAAALHYWQRVADPPTPRPEVAPGWALTGKPAYLVVRGEREPSWRFATPMGLLVISARPRYTVDWGDGSPAMSTDSPGVPYPGGPGEVTHLYQTAGDWTLTLTTTWMASWRIGGGPELALPARERSASVPVPARQVQAVRQR